MPGEDDDMHIDGYEDFSDDPGVHHIFTHPMPLKL